MVLLHVAIPTVQRELPKYEIIIRSLHDLLATYRVHGGQITLQHLGVNPYLPIITIVKTITQSMHSPHNKTVHSLRSQTIDTSTLTVQKEVPI